MVEDAPGSVGSFVGVISYINHKQEFWVWTYTTDKFGIIFSKEPKMSETQIKEAVEALTEMGYSIEVGSNFYPTDNSNCAAPPMMEKEDRIFFWENYISMIYWYINDDLYTSLNVNYKGKNL